jgi:hypothetical protein
MAVCDGLRKDWIVGDLGPIDLGAVCKLPCLSRKHEGLLTSLRHFCSNIANRNRVMALSLADMMSVLSSLASWPVLTQVCPLDRNPPSSILLDGWNEVAKEGKGPI